MLCYPTPVSAPVPNKGPLLVDLDSPVDSLDKEACSPCANGTAHEEEAHAEQRHVPEVKADLQQPCHLCFVEKVENGVQEDVESGTASRKEGHPLPVVIL